MNRWRFLTLISITVLLFHACASKGTLDRYVDRANTNISENCVDKNGTKSLPQTVKAETITLSVKICIFYSGDGWRPVNPKEPNAEDLDRLLSGEVYFVAYLRDGANMKNLEIKSDILGSLSRSQDVVFNYDLYQGSPSERLEVDLGVYDDDGWPSDRSDKLKVFQDNLGSALELFPPDTVGIPFIDPILKLGVAIINLIDPDDALISTKIFIEKQKDPGGHTPTWKLYNPFIATDNGVISFTIHPRSDCPCPLLDAAPK